MITEVGINQNQVIRKAGLIKRLLLFLFIVSFLYAFPQNQSVVIIKIIDGDSYIANTGIGNIEIRLEGIDCPELDQPFGQEAKQAVEDLIDQTVTISKKGKDRYGRTLVDLYLNEAWVNYFLVANGYAWHFKKYSDDPILAQAEVDARKSELGLWVFYNPIAPWDWRAGIKTTISSKTSNSVNFYPSKTLQISSPEEKAGSKVVICEGPSSKRYHKSENCTGLRNCRGGLSTVSLKEAEKIGRTPCQICY